MKTNYMNKYAKAEITFLDSIDLIEDINKFKYKDVSDLMDYIKEKYKKIYIYEDDYLFNCIDSIEFMGYIKEKYNISCCYHEYYTID